MFSHGKYTNKSLLKHQYFTARLFSFRANKYSGFHARKYSGFITNKSHLFWYGKYTNNSRINHDNIGTEIELDTAYIRPI
jgi:hypothetical protein